MVIGEVERNRLEKYAEERVEEFREALRAAPPPEYRWVAWQTQMDICCKGLINRTKSYAEWIEEGCKDKHYVTEVKKDIDRTYGRHPYFQIK